MRVKINPKSIIALITVVMFIFSLKTPAAFATTKEEAFGRLNGLGVVVGDETGNPQYNKNFTRAEAAAIMVNLSGMKSNIISAKGTTLFKDVPASHWASGVVNLATKAGIIKGYSSGLYRPDQNVTYAEMSAMLVGVLGYTPILQGTWPSNVIGKVAQLGLLDGIIIVDFNKPAIRANVFLTANNALDVKPLKKTNYGYEVDSKTLMERILGETVIDEDTVSGTPPAVTTPPVTTPSPAPSVPVVPNPPVVTGPWILIADDNEHTYLGKLTTNSFDPDSIFNQFGTYGNKFSVNSIWNEFGTFGSDFSLYSPFNEFTITPPLIVDGNGNTVGRLSVNKFVLGSISPYSIYSVLQSLGL